MSASHDDDPDPEVLSLLSAIQSSFQAVPTFDQIADMIVHGLHRIPVIAEARLEFLDGDERLTAPTPVDPSPKSRHEVRRLELRTMRQSYGHLTVHVVDDEAFGIYEPFVRNLLVAVANEIENRLQRKKLAEIKQALDEERKRLEEELDYKDDVMAMLGHELRNPLAAIESAIAIQQSISSDDERLSRSRNIIARQTQQMTRLVDDLLDISRTERGKITLDKDPVDLREVVEGVTADFRPQMERQDRVFEVSLPDRPLPVVVDTERIAQVLGNLLDNALQYSDTTSRIELRLEADDTDNEAVLSVVDQGDGLDPDEIDSLFLPFRQVSRDRAGTGEGLGLGLALVKGLVEAHDGTVDAHSEGPGTGATFCVRLPLEESALSDVDVESEDDTAAPSEHVLVIEDNPDVAYSLKQLLELEDHHVTVANDADSAIDYYEAERPNVVLCDIGLDGPTDGYDIARTIRRDDDGPRCLVALTGFDTPKTHRHAEEAGFDRFLTKPVDASQLEELLADDDNE